MAAPTGTPDACCVYSTINALCLRVNWDTVDGATGYDLWRSPILHDSYALVSAGIPGLTYFDDLSGVNSGLNLNLRYQYYYKVKAGNSDGLGPFSFPSTYEPYYQLSGTNTAKVGLSWWSLIDA